MADDIGYGDFQSFGHPIQEYGGVDRMVKEGMRFTQWTSAATLCSPSRAALLTGRYAIRSGLRGDATPVFQPQSVGGLPRKEITIAESLKALGYRTGLVGKWHLGINRNTSTDGYHLPHNHGFDFVGTNLPLTHMEMCNPAEFTVAEMSTMCFVYNGSTIVEQPVNFSTLTDKITSDAKNFISNNRLNSFFLYFSPPQAHRALFCAERFCGRSKRGPYGDTINEMSSAISDILDHLVQLEIDDNTLVIFLSDHGPNSDKCPNGGVAGLFKAGKGTTWEGGLRVPAVAWWPGVIPAGTVSDAVVSTLDVHPTLLKIAALRSLPCFKKCTSSATPSSNLYAKAENQKPIPSKLFDGIPIPDLICSMKHQRTSSCLSTPTNRILFHYCGEEILAVRYGDLKFHFKSNPPIQRRSNCVRTVVADLIRTFSCGQRTHDPPLLFNLLIDPSEEIPLNISHYSEELSEVQRLIRKHKRSIKDVPAQYSPNVPEVQPCCNPPSCICNYNTLNV
ncbi:arylsulfatase-like [Ciona intestinalis]